MGAPMGAPTPANIAPTAPPAIAPVPPHHTRSSEPPTKPASVSHVFYHAIMLSDFALGKLALDVRGVISPNANVDTDADHNCGLGGTP